MDIINISAADLQGPKKTSDSAKSKQERTSGRSAAKSVSDHLNISAASLEMEKKLRALSEELSMTNPIRTEMLEEVKERLDSGELESDEAIREAVESLFESLDLEDETQSLFS